MANVGAMTPSQSSGWHWETLKVLVLIELT